MKKSRGYAIMELFIFVALIAIALYAFITISAIISVLVMASLSFIGYFKGRKLASAAEKLASDLRYAQSQSMNEVLRHGAHFEVNPINTYYIYQTDGTISNPEPDPADPGKDLTVNLKDRFGVTIDDVELEGGQNSVEFNEFGVPFTGFNGRPVSSEGSIVLRINSSTKTVAISPDSGRVTIQ